MGFVYELIQEAKRASVDNLEKLSTGKLLSILQQIRVNTSILKHDDSIDENTKILYEYKDKLKSVLATREHILNKKERKEIRQKKAKQKL